MDEEHYANFREFARLDRAAGGPDSHMATVGSLVSGLPEGERIWRIGVYVSVYNVPSAIAIWSWRPSEVIANPVALEGWLRQHWKVLPLRRERKAVRSPAKLARCIASYAEWMQKPIPASYEEAWKSADAIYGFGRYAKIKLLEALHRYVGRPAERIPDLRADGGWSPREGLALLYPEHADRLNGDDSADNVALADELAEEVRVRMATDGVPLDAYETQVFLCDYKQAWNGRQYPGRSLDSELEYARKAEEAFDVTSMYVARGELFDPRCLGEKNGWPGVRKELGAVLRDSGITWTDTEYDYLSSAAPMVLVRR